MYQLSVKPILLSSKSKMLQKICTIQCSYNYIRYRKFHRLELLKISNVLKECSPESRFSNDCEVAIFVKRSTTDSAAVSCILKLLTMAKWSIQSAKYHNDRDKKIHGCLKNEWLTWASVPLCVVYSTLLWPIPLLIHLTIVFTLNSVSFWTEIVNNAPKLFAHKRSTEVTELTDLRNCVNNFWAILNSPRLWTVLSCAWSLLDFELTLVCRHNLLHVSWRPHSVFSF